jgi:hypothetical protein
MKSVSVLRLNILFWALSTETVPVKIRTMDNFEESCFRILSIVQCFSLKNVSESGSFTVLM